MTDLLLPLQRALGDAYRLEGELPGGGMSRVFLATESSLNRKVVIKVLPPEFTSEVSAARFKQEMEFAARLQHPHILPVLAAGAREGLLYYVMPFASGESLRHRIDREGRLSTGDTLRLVTEIADALAFAHSHGIIHRDIKPENVLLEGKHAVLADFGIARALIESRTGDRLTRTGVAVGTPGYMSPEQLAGDDIDARTDVYALAIVAYEMLSGAPPFTGPTAQAVLAAHLTQAPKPLHEVRADVPPAVSAVIGRALSKDVSDRFATAVAFAEALQAAEPSSSVSVDVPARASRSRPFPTRAALLLAVLVVGGVLLVRAVSQRARTSALVPTLTAATDSGDFDEVARRLGDASVDLRASAFASLVPRIAGFLAVTSTPAEASLTITRVTPVDDFPSRQPISVGNASGEVRALVPGEYLLRFSAPGRDTLALLVDIARGDTSTITASLPPIGVTPRVVLVSGFQPDSGTVLHDFLIARDETTNEEFQRFVNAGGYRSAEFWPDTMVFEGRALPREQALTRLIDETGLPGPRGWSAGRFPEAKAKHPVVGVTWYEANAYAQWARGTLPTTAQWWRAALGAGGNAFPWGRDASTVELRANFGLGGTAEVGTHPLGISPYGVHDLAGNVGEWLADDLPARHRRMVVGGSWREPSYMFERPYVKVVESGAGSDIVGFRIVMPAPGVSR